MANRAATSRCLLASILIAVVACIVAGASSKQLECLWDEQVDHDIAISLRDHPLVGEHPAIDASQMRLPMYINAIAYRLAGRDDLSLSRTVSLVFAGITIVAAASLGAVLFGPLAGFLAALLLGLSPYFLSFARIAMTEGDILFSCFVTLAVLTFVLYLRQPTSGRWLLAALMIAFALSAKFFAIFLIPVFLVLAASTTSPRVGSDIATRRRTGALLLYLATGIFIILVSLVVTFITRKTISVSAHSSQIAIGGWIIESVITLLTAIHIWRQRSLPANPLARCLTMFVFATMLCCTLIPVHMTEPDIALELLRRTLHWDHQFPLALWSDHLRLYSGIILVKLTIPLGVLSAAALLYAAFRERNDGRWRPCILSVIFYVTLLCFLPLRQTFYLMGVYPLVAVTVAGFFVQIRSWLKSSAGIVIWSLLVLAAFGHLAWSASTSYPYFHLHAYSFVGDHWMGKESRGYRNLIQTPSDGVEELIRWCNTDSSVRTDAKVVSYLWEERIIETILPRERHYKFIPRGLSQENDAIPAAPLIADADFILLHLNNLLGYGDRQPDTPPMDQLAKNFKIVHTVSRGPLAVAWVYARRT